MTKKVNLADKYFMKNLHKGKPFSANKFYTANIRYKRKKYQSYDFIN
jgi:hypothetical protein